MQKIITGKAFVYGSNVDTDQIYPGRYLELTNPDEIGRHAMEGVDPRLVREFEPGDLIIAARNFGCGSSREQAVIALKALGVGAILGESFGRIFYRNGINLGIPLLICDGIARIVHRGDRLTVDMGTGSIQNIDTGATAQAEPISDYVLHILESGGIKELVKKQIASQSPAH
jgi:3-isopropylmalate/(R)-2-methylmalate dehydratase small subunit